MMRIKTNGARLDYRSIESMTTSDALGIRFAGRAGFTLAELLVAMGLSVFLLALVAALLTAATGAINTSQGIAAADQAVRDSVTVLNDDLKSIYLAYNGTPLTLGELFTDAEKAPNQGYFMIENDRALPGMDNSGLPVEIDTDDVLAFTVGHPVATKASDYYYGRVTNLPGVSNPPGNRNIVNDLGEYFDNLHGTPYSRFDVPNNEQYTSRFAEVVYFLRPQGRQYSSADLRTDPSNPNLASPSTPALYTLYRRQLLVVEGAQELNRNVAANRPGFVLGPPHVPTGKSFYDMFDLSASREYDAATGTWLFPDGAGPPLARIHFNTLADLAKRENRFGMRHVQFPHPTNMGEFLYRAVPLSHPIQGNPIGLLHDYLRSVPTNPGTDPSLVVPWFGRPTQFETGHPNFQLFPQPTVNRQLPLDMVDADLDGVIDNYRDFVGQRYGDDVLLTNVVSFDVKVFEDLEFPNALPTGGGVVDQIRLLAPDRVNAVNDNDITAAPFNVTGVAAAFNATTDVTTRGISGAAFVDLGYGYDNLRAMFQLYRPPGAIPTPSRSYFYPGIDDATLAMRYSRYTFSPTAAPFGFPVRPYIDHSNTGAAYYDAQFDAVAGADGILGTADDFTGAQLETIQLLSSMARGADSQPGRTGDDDGNGVLENGEEYLTPGSDDMSPSFLFSYRTPGRVGSTSLGVGGGFDQEEDLNWGFLNPRNTYDTWVAGSSDYDPNPDLPGATPTPNPKFRPVPYPRPLKGIQIKIRVFDAKSGLVREVTLRHHFDSK
ncbi:MAG: hypothetical protein U1D30_26120 [Planctomycetota bacterium]